MLTTLKKSAKRLFFAAAVSALLAVGTTPVSANTLEYLGSDSQGNQYTLGCGSSAGDYIMVYNVYTKTYTFYDTVC